MVIDQEKIRKPLSKIHNWKASGPDMVQGLWLKNFKSVHTRLADQLNRCLKLTSREKKSFFQSTEVGLLFTKIKFF